MGTAKETKDPQKKLHEIVDAARTVLLLSHGEDGKIVGRPMALQKSKRDSMIYLASGIDSKKVAEIEQDSRVSVAIQNREGYAMIAGTCRVSQDRQLIEELWQDDWKVWWPKGKSDPEIAILVVDPAEATIWDQDLGHGLSYLYRYVKARVTGEAIETKPSDQQKVDLRH